MKALVLVDLQNDFFPGGALAVKKADKILPAINALMKLPFDLIVATKDWHPKGHMSFASTHGKKVGEVIEVESVYQILWPDHCIQESWGSEFAPGWPNKKVDEVFLKGTSKSIDSYSTFFDNQMKKSTGLENYLREQGIDTVYLAGLATDYCVKYSAFDAKSLGFDVIVVEDACQGVNLKPGDDKLAFEEMRALGIKVQKLGKLGNFNE